MSTLTVDDVAGQHGLTAEQAEVVLELREPLHGSRIVKNHQWYERLAACIEAKVPVAVMASVSGRSVSSIGIDLRRARTARFIKGPIPATPTVQEPPTPTAEPTSAAQPQEPTAPAPAEPAADDAPASAANGQATSEPVDQEPTAPENESAEEPSAAPAATEPDPSVGRPMSDEHKAAIATGRIESAAVRAYLTALEAHKPKRGRKVSAEQMAERLEAVNGELSGGKLKALPRLHLLQERRDIEAALVDLDTAPDLSEAEAGFVEHGANFSARKGIAYATWREFGVPAAVLKQAGISRARS